MRSMASRISISRQSCNRNRESQIAIVEPFYASDYFEQIYEYAVALIKKGKAYVCDLSPEDTDEYRGAPDRPARTAPSATAASRRTSTSSRG